MNSTKNFSNKLRLPLAKEGFPFIGIGAGVTLTLWIIGLTLTAFVAGALTLFVIFFFRDPDRVPPSGHGIVLSPADGKVLEVKRVESPDNPLGEPAIKVSIFMSVFNVHVNRNPVDGLVEEIEYHPGKFLSANLDKASSENERNLIKLLTEDSHRIVVTQIAGLIARRIVCHIEKGDRVTAGRRFGLIRFGSRLELLLPIGSSISVRKGAMTQAGTTIIGRLP
jgi:phosphatidylserine decarboxylase